MYLPAAPPIVDNMPQTDIGGNSETDSDDDEDNDEDRFLDAVADISAANSLPCEADTSSLAVVEALQCEQIECTGARSYNIDETDSDEFDNSDDDDDDDDNGFWLSIGAVNHASSAANSLPCEADTSSLAVVEALQCEQIECTGARSYNIDETDSDEFDNSDDDDDNNDNGFWLSIGAVSHASSSASSLPSNANNSSIAMVETPLENSEAEDDADDEIEVDSLVASTAVDSESVSLQREADGLGHAAVEAPLTTVKGALHCSAGKACYHRPKGNGSIPSYAMPTFASAQWHRKKFAAY